jgi:hypothetical protein
MMIPLDNPLMEFKHHLATHPRTILSARFGDGKTFFLNELKKSSASEYKILRIIPVNYQVASNEDIFELVKWDLFLQLYCNDMVAEEAINVTEADALLYSLKRHGGSFIEDLASLGSKVATTSTVFSVICKILEKTPNLVKTFKKAKESYHQVMNGEKPELEQKLSSIESIKLYEEDVLTLFIKRCIKDWKQKHQDIKVVLVFDDMDRIDPAHLFRILNVLSAHMDFGYKYGVDPDETLATSKFGLDNVVIVLDFDNLKSIFAHFYGLETDFNGYINKFCDRGVFRYSLKESSYIYYYRQLVELTGMEEVFIHEIISIKNIRDSKKSIRDLVSSLYDIKSQLVIPKELHGIRTTPLILLAVMRRLGLDDSDIRSVLSSIRQSNPLNFFTYFGLIVKAIVVPNDGIVTNGEKNNGGTKVYKIRSSNADGFANVNVVTYMGNAPSTNWDKFESAMISIAGR